MLEPNTDYSRGGGEQHATHTRGLLSAILTGSLLSVAHTEGFAQAPSGQPAGMSYFKAPDKSIVKMTQVPSIAKDFADVYGWVGTPKTWPSIYDMTLEPAESPDTYELRGTYKPNAPTHAGLDKAAGSTLDHVLLDVDAQTYDPVRVTWLYRNGATIVMNVTTQAVDGKYRLPQRESLDMSIPHEHASAQVTYGNYQTNIAIADSTFAKP